MVQTLPREGLGTTYPLIQAPFQAEVDRAVAKTMNLQAEAPSEVITTHALTLEGATAVLAAEEAREPLCAQAQLRRRPRDSERWTYLDRGIILMVCNS